jgi:hypothetical protein
VPLTVVPATAVAGRATVVLTSARLGVIDLLSVLLARLVSGTVEPLALAVTVAPLVPTKTLMGRLTVPKAGMVWVVVVLTPLMTTVEVKVVGTLLLLV